MFIKKKSCVPWNFRFECTNSTLVGRNEEALKKAEGEYTIGHDLKVFSQLHKCE